MTPICHIAATPLTLYQPRVHQWFYPILASSGIYNSSFCEKFYVEISNRAKREILFAKSFSNKLVARNIWHETSFFERAINLKFRRRAVISSKYLVKFVIHFRISVWEKNNSLIIELQLLVFRVWNKNVDEIIFNYQEQS